VIMMCLRVMRRGAAVLKKACDRLRSGGVE